MAPSPIPHRGREHRSPRQGDPSSRQGDPEEDGRDPAARTRAAAARLIALDTRTGARHLVADAASAAAARGVVRRGAEDDRDLLSAAAELHQVAGWIAFDAEHQYLSRRLSLEALRLARAAGDRSMRHFVLSQLAMQDVHVGRPDEAAHICDTVSAETRGSVRTLFTLRAARAAGRRGERSRALDLIRLTHSRHLDGPRAGDPAWAWWLSEAEIAWHHAMVHADTGDRAGAVERFAAATDRPGYPRAEFVARASLLWALARARAWGEAEAVLADGVLPSLGGVSSVRVERMLADAARRLDGATRRPSLRDAARSLTESLDPEGHSARSGNPGTGRTR